MPVLVAYARWPRQDTDQLDTFQFQSNPGADSVGAFTKGGHDQKWRVRMGQPQSGDVLAQLGFQPVNCRGVEAAMPDDADDQGNP